MNFSVKVCKLGDCHIKWSWGIRIRFMCFLQLCLRSGSFQFGSNVIFLLLFVRWSSSNCNFLTRVANAEFPSHTHTHTHAHAHTHTQTHIPLCRQFGARHIIDAMNSNGHNVQVILICGGLRHNKQYIQTHSNITSEQT